MRVSRRLILAALLHAAVTIVIALIGGGWWGLGRVDPLFAVPGLGWASVAMWWVCQSTGWRGAAIAGLSTASMCAIVAAMFGIGALPWLQMVFLAGMSVILAVLCGHVLGKYARRYSAIPIGRMVSLGILTLTMPILTSYCCWLIIPSLYDLPTHTNGPKLVILTSLPLISGQGDVAAVLAGQGVDEPALALLRQRFRVTMVDAVDPAALANTDVLLLAHPRAMAPQQFVTIDDWMRGGGKVLILADGLSSWEPQYPIGDPRNPSLTSLFTPLLSHWGLTLDAPPGLVAREEIVHDGGQRLHLFSSGRLHVSGDECRLLAKATIADCRIGSGRALIVADADLLSARYWGGTGKGGVGTPSIWHSGNMLWLNDRLDALTGQQSSRGWAEPVWTR